MYCNNKLFDLLLGEVTNEFETPIEINKAKLWCTAYVEMKHTVTVTRFKRSNRQLAIRIQKLNDFTEEHKE